MFQGAKTGKDNGYTMLFDIEAFDYSYYDEGSEGLKVALVHHLDMPIMRQTGFHIAPGLLFFLFTWNLFTCLHQCVCMFTSLLSLFIYLHYINLSLSRLLNTSR